jgi:calmodulin
VTKKAQGDYGQPQKLKDILKDPKALKKVKENAVQQFKEADKDGNNTLDIHEFEASCRKYNALYDFPEPTSDQVKVALETYDKNRDGKLSLEEYQTMIIEVLKVLAKLEE